MHSSLWLTTEELYNLFNNPDEIKNFNSRSIYDLLRKWRTVTPILLDECRHYASRPTSDTDPTPVRIYSLPRVCNLIILHRFSDPVCRKIYPTTRFAKICNTLDNGYKKR